MSIQKNLFDNTAIKNMKLKNRFFKSAVWESLAREDGHMTNELYEIYDELSKGGVGTIITGYAYVDREEHPNPNMMGIYDDSFIDEYKKLTDIVHKNNTNIIMQIVYGGTMTGLKPPSEKIFGPTSIENETTSVTSVEMSKEDIKELIKKFGSAALRVKKSGFDGVQMHGAHGYLLSQFLSPYFNRRTDEYGGSIENRARIILEIYKAIREAVGDDFTIAIKINSEDFHANGLTSEDSIKVCKMLEQEGIDIIEVSGGDGSIKEVVKNNLAAARTGIVTSIDKESYFREHAKKLASVIKTPVILTGGNRHFSVMSDILSTSNISYFALARPFISEPDLINKWQLDNTKKPQCVSCNQCYKTVGKRCILNIKKGETK